MEGLITQTQRLHETYPPDSLPQWAWRHVSPFSALKTTRNLHAVSQQSLEDGERLLDKLQADFKRRKERRKRQSAAWAQWLRWRRPVAGLGLAVGLAVLAAYIGRAEVR